MDNTCDFFNYLYENYETNENKEFYEKSSKEILHKLKEHSNEDISNVIDLCCGTGILTKLISESIDECSILGLDISDKMISIAKQKNIKNVDYLICNVNNLHDVGKKMDAIVSNYGVQWLNAKGLQNISSLLKIGGLLIISIPGYTTGGIDVDSKKANYVGNMLFKVIINESRKFEKKDGINYAQNVIQVWQHTLDSEKIKTIANHCNLTLIDSDIKSFCINYRSAETLVKSIVNRGTFGDALINSSKEFNNCLINVVDKYKNHYSNLTEECITEYLIFKKGE